MHTYHMSLTPDETFFQFFDQIFNQKPKEETIPLSQFWNGPENEKIPPWILKKLIPAIRFSQVIGLYPSQAKRLKKDIENTNRIPKWYNDLIKEAQNSNLFFTPGVFQRFKEFKETMQKIMSEWNEQKEREGLAYYLVQNENKQTSWKIKVSFARYEFWSWMLLHNANMRKYKIQMDKYVHQSYPLENHWDIAGKKHINWMNKFAEIIPDWARDAVDYRYLNSFDLF